MKKILLIGGSSLLATNCVMCLREQAEIILLNHRREVHFPNVKTLKSDFSRDHIEDITTRLAPDLVINTSGFTNVDECEQKPSVAFAINADLASMIADICNKAKVKFVHISTDHLFDGKQPYYKESELPSPVNVYAESKLAGERGVLEACPNALVARTNFFGWGVLKDSITDWMLSNLRAERNIHAFTDVYFSPIAIEQLISLILSAVEKDASGIFNFVGDERLSKYDFALRLADVFALNKRLIEPALCVEKKMNARRPRDMSLDNSKIKLLLSVEKVALDDGLLLLKQQEENDWPALLQQSIN